MKQDPVKSVLSYAGWLGVLCVILAVTVTDSRGVPIDTMDKTGKPLVLEEEVKKDPARYIEAIKIDLRRGNLDRIAHVGGQLVKTKPRDPDVRALYSIFLISEGELRKAREELKAAGKENHNNQYALYAEAMVLHHEKNYIEGITVCKKAIELDRTHPYPWNILGLIYIDTKEYKKATESFLKAVGLESKFNPAYTNLGVCNYKTGRYGDSIGYFRKAISIDPKAEKAHLGLAVTYEAIGKSPSAIEEFKKAIELKPNIAVALRRLASLELRTGRYKDALKTGKQMELYGVGGAYETLGEASLHMGDAKGAIQYLKKVPPNGIATDYLIGYCFMAERRYEKALEQMEKVLKSDRDHFGAYAARAVLKFSLGEMTDSDLELNAQWNSYLSKLLYFIAGSVSASEGNWNIALKRFQLASGMIGGFSIDGIDEDDFVKALHKKELPFINLGILYYVKNLNDYAFIEFDNALKINQDSILANYWAALALMKRGDKRKAIAFLEKAASKAPNFFAAIYALGELNFSIGNIDLARQYYERALAVKGDAGLVIKLGLISENLGEYDKAEKYYKQAVSDYPDMFAGYNQLAWFYATRGISLDKAISLAKKADKLKPNDASILDTLGWIYFKKKEYDEALSNLGRAIEMQPNNPTMLYHIGAVYYALGNKTQATQNLEKALSISDDFREAGEVQKLLLH